MHEFSKLCRACLSATDTFKYYLFEDVSPDVYWFCTNIEVVKDEILPKSICDTCYNLIMKFSQFKNTCLQSQNTLLNYSVLYPVVPENKKLAWLNNDIIDNDSKKDSLNKFEGKYEEVTVKVEDFGANYDDDFDQTELPIETDVKVKINKSDKKVRVKPKTARENLKCELCSKSFVSSETFEIHKLTHKKKKALKCTSCNKTFVTRNGLKRHYANWHVRVRLSSLRCGTCGKIARSREALRVHQRLHGERILFICSLCGKACATSGVLKVHMETHKENRERTYTCEHCGKKFYTNKTLASHLHRCHTDKRYICQICSYPFTDKYNLAKHMLNHDGKGRAFECEVCNKSYTTRNSYIEHQRTHSGERPYSCNYCSKSFTAKRRLLEHGRIHTGEKPHKCSVCEHSFAQRGTLTRHMKVHNRLIVPN